MEATIKLLFTESLFIKIIIKMLLHAVAMEAAHLKVLFLHKPPELWLNT